MEELRLESLGIRRERRGHSFASDGYFVRRSWLMDLKMDRISADLACKPA